MHLCFVDESGTPPNRPDPRHPYFTLGAVIIQDRCWNEIADDVRGFVTRHRLKGELKWRYFSPHNSSEGNPMLGRNAVERKALSIEFAKLIAASDLTIIASITDVEVAFQYASVSNQQELYHFAYKPLSERFQYFLQDHKSLGVIIADHRGRDNDRLFRAHHEALTSKQGATNSGYDRFIEGLFLQDSSHSVGVQIADFVAGAIHRGYCTDDVEHAAIIKSKIRRRPDGNIQGHGLVHHPKDRFRRGLRR